MHDTLRGEREVGACYDILYNSAWQYIVTINCHFPHKVMDAIS